MQHLKDVIKTNFTGQFQSVMLQLVRDTPYVLAQSLYYATEGFGTNERVLIEVIGTLQNSEAEAVKAAYQNCGFLFSAG